LLLHFQQAESLVHDVVEEKFYCALPEITVYLKEGIGNQTRIDYGTGRLYQLIIRLSNLMTPGGFVLVYYLLI